MIRGPRARLLCVALLLGLPLHAQEDVSPVPAPPAAEAPPAASPPAVTPPAEVAEEEAVPADERVSADNNLSFPVDI